MHHDNSRRIAKGVRAIILFWTAGGNTEKAARAAEKGLKSNRGAHGLETRGTPVAGYGWNGLGAPAAGPSGVGAKRASPLTKALSPPCPSFVACATIIPMNSVGISHQ